MRFRRSSATFSTNVDDFAFRTVARGLRPTIPPRPPPHNYSTSSASPRQYHGQLPGDIPYGVQRLLSVALAYGTGAKVLLLDEPAAGLSGGDMKKLADVLIGLRKRGARPCGDRASHGPDHVNRRPHSHDRPGRDAGDGNAERRSNTMSGVREAYLGRDE